MLRACGFEDRPQIVRILLFSPFCLRHSNELKALSNQHAHIRMIMYKD